MNIGKAFLLCLAALGAATQSVAWAHASLEVATPVSDAQLASAPADITLKFNEKLEASFSAIKVFDAAGKNVDAGKATVDPVDAAVLHAKLPVLKSGVYTVKWAAVGPDGHRRTGDYKFSIK